MSDYDDLVQRLRDEARWHSDYIKTTVEWRAADAIERLQADLAEAGGVIYGLEATLDMLYDEIADLNAKLAAVNTSPGTVR